MRSDERPAVEPVFLLGISHRSGTNYLASLLEQHSDIVHGPIPEDFIVAKLGFLAAYLDRVRQEWSLRWDPDGSESALTSALSAGLISFLSQKSSPGVTRVLSRTPSVVGLEHLRRFFPDAFVILLVRDGRAVVESGIRSFSWHFDDATRRWAAGAVSIRNFRLLDPCPQRTLLVHYEDLVKSPAGTLAEVWRFLDLDPGRFPANAESRTGIIGSSELRSEGGELHWQPEAIENFDPLSRFAHWSRANHRRFDWLAGPELEALGYQRDRGHGGLPNCLLQSARTMVSLARPRDLKRRLRKIRRRTGNRS